MTKKTGLDLLREPFPENQIGRLPKPTKAQTDAIKANFKAGIRCKECGGWHHKDVVHLDYVGHAALTDRLLDADPNWNWEPVEYNEQGLPAFDPTGGLWIKLTVCGVTRLGYGHAAASSFKEIGSREKEVIGDALRNASMRFGAALELWHKGDLHVDDPEPEKPEKPPENASQAKPNHPALVKSLKGCKTKAEVDDLLKRFTAKYGPKTLEEQAGKSIQTYMQLFTDALKFVK